jgi:hypothetical protein
MLNSKGKTENSHSFQAIVASRLPLIGSLQLNELENLLNLRFRHESSQGIKLRCREILYVEEVCPTYNEQDVEETESSITADDVLLMNENVMLRQPPKLVNRKKIWSSFVFSTSLQ